GSTRRSRSRRSRAALARRSSTPATAKAVPRPAARVSRPRRATRWCCSRQEGPAHRPRSARAPHTIVEDLMDQGEKDAMERVAIISVDGHVKAPRAGYRDYIDPKWRGAFDDWVKSTEGTPDGFVRANCESAQWDPKRRVADLEPQGVAAEVLFASGAPFADGRVDYAPDPEQTRQPNMAFNRWVIAFCSEAPGRLHGQALVSFDDVDQAVKDVHWAKEQGLVGILRPPLDPGSKFFFDPALDPIWAACQDVGLPLSQHGGTGAPDYQPQVFAAFMVLAAEHSFFSGRSLWQLILGGAFDRFPDLKIAFI